MSIWLSIIVFNNHITVLSAIGTVFVFFGVLLYKQAKQIQRETLYSLASEHAQKPLLQDHDMKASQS